MHLILKPLGYKLLPLVPDGKLKIFLFEPEAEDAVLSFYNGGMVLAGTFHETIRSLKAQANPRR